VLVRCLPERRKPRSQDRRPSRAVPASDDRSQAAGVNVVLAHRLLKNSVGRRAYILLTEAALRWAGLDPDLTGLDAHTERYEHFGDVRYFVRDLDTIPVPV